jgi:ribonuclease HI
MSRTVHIYTDGGSRGNPGPAASAFIAVVGEGKEAKIIRKRTERIGKATNNEAEYKALIIGLLWANSREFDIIKIHSDSQLMVKQLKGYYKVKAPNIKPLYKKVMELLNYSKWSIEHHRRTNKWIMVCDELVNMALDNG